MSPPVEAVTTTALSLALQAGSLRQQAIATNIAHAGNPAHTRLAVNFEGQLAAARQSLQQAGRIDPATLAGVRPALVPAHEAQGASRAVQLDTEMLELARNAVHQQALLQGLSRHLSLLAIATADGRR